VRRDHRASRSVEERKGVRVQYPETQYRPPHVNGVAAPLWVAAATPEETKPEGLIVVR
jgi:hypothetical protein